jgi:hypothetical protein
MRSILLLAGLLLGTQALADGASSLADWRKSRLERLTAEESWTSLIGLHWLDREKPSSIGSDSGNDIVIEGLPARFATVRHTPDGWKIAFADGVNAWVDGNAASREVTLRTDAQAGKQNASATKVSEDNIRFILIERGDRVGLRVWDTNASTRLQFAGLQSFPAADDWRIVADWQPHDPPGSIDIATIINTIEPMANPGAAVFERNGKTYRLQALLEEGSDQLFFIFADRTSGKTTYGAGRYLYTDMPDQDGKVVLDFNRAYNPPCVFSPYATCPLPPPENRLDLVIDAGEMKYAKEAAH